MVKKAKQEYRKLYLSDYQKEYTKNRVQITFRVTKKQYRAFLSQATSQKLKVSTWVKRRVLSKENKIASSDMKTLKLQILQAIDITEESIQEKEPLETNKLLGILKQMKALL